MVSVARERTAVVPLARGGTVTKAGGALDFVSFSSKGGETGLMGIRLTYQRPKYGHRGSGK